MRVPEDGVYEPVVASHLAAHRFSLSEAFLNRIDWATSPVAGFE